MTFDYSIEPIYNPSSSSFYQTFILVNEGDFVKKGDIIAYMYLTPNSDSSAHIHFHISKGNNHLSPSIFNDSIAKAFSERWLEGRATESDTAITAPCLGYLLNADENPFENTGVDCL